MEPTGGTRRRLSPEEREQRRRRRHEARASATYHEFLTLASAELGLSPKDCEPVITAVLSALEQRLPFDEMSDLASQLPYKLRELLASCLEERMSLLPREIGQAEFLAMVARDLDVSPEEAELRVRDVFRVLAQTVSAGEIEQVRNVLPRALRAMWPAM